MKVTPYFYFGFLLWVLAFSLLFLAQTCAFQPVKKPSSDKYFGGRN